MALEYELGPLELAIMQLMWRNPSQTVREICTELSKQREIAITTVSTTMDRLYQKGLLTRKTKTGKGGIFYIYKVRTTKEGFENKASKTLANQLMKNVGSSAVLKIIGEVSKRYSDEELDSLIKDLEKVRKSKRRGKTPK